MCIRDRAGTGATSGGRPVTGGSGGDCDGNECWDGDACRTELETSDCPRTYGEIPNEPPLDATACSGPTSSGDYVYVVSDFAHRVCAYDSSGDLFAARYDDDNTAHCFGRAATVSAGAPLPAGVLFTDFDRYRGPSAGSDCRAVGPSAVFNELFSDVVPLECEPGVDGCRSALALLVCEDGTCRGCTSDDECTAEYPYLNAWISCENGLCRPLGARPVGTCNDGARAPECETAQGSFACEADRCARCTTDRPCIDATDEPRAICVAESGTCVVQ